MEITVPHKKKNNPVQALKNGKIKVFETSRAAADKLSLSQDVIMHAIWGTHNLKTHQYAGYIWGFCYPEEVGKREVGPFRGKKHSSAARQKMSDAKSSKMTVVERVSKTGKIRRFDSISAAARYIAKQAVFKLARQGISRAVNGHVHTYLGYVWRRA